MINGWRSVAKIPRLDRFIIVTEKVLRLMTVLPQISNSRRNNSDIVGGMGAVCLLGGNFPVLNSD